MRHRPRHRPRYGSDTANMHAAGICWATRKKTYPSKRAARRAARMLAQDSRLRAYKCGAGHWHLTSQPQGGTT